MIPRKSEMSPEAGPKNGGFVTGKCQIAANTSQKTRCCLVQFMLVKLIKLVEDSA